MIPLAGPGPVLPDCLSLAVLPFLNTLGQDRRFCLSTSPLQSIHIDLAAQRRGENRRLPSPAVSFPYTAKQRESLEAAWTLVAKRVGTRACGGKLASGIVDA